MAITVKAHITGTVWKIAKRVGDTVAKGEAIVVLESMKMELPVEAPIAGRLSELKCSEGDAVEEGAELAIVE
ncbi:MAG: acetyl-CoA carboxylase biotin carboxyl carrier protein subunit [Proteobacteria bacterium]|nr:acetyl-CoA carboxylase biotin carboxyl carrier protein subunit [Pseudomonadota bacterium]